MFQPSSTVFKPQGVPARLLEHVNLPHDEAEALRLKDLEGLDQNGAAERMGVSQSTFQRILTSARQKVSDAVINGKSLHIDTESRFDKAA